MDAEYCRNASRFTIDFTTYSGNTRLGDGFEYAVDSIMQYSVPACIKHGLQTLVSVRLAPGMFPVLKISVGRGGSYGCSWDRLDRYYFGTIGVIR